MIDAKEDRIKVDAITLQRRKWQTLKAFLNVYDYDSFMQMPQAVWIASDISDKLTWSN